MAGCPSFMLKYSVILFSKYSDNALLRKQFYSSEEKLPNLQGM